MHGWYHSKKVSQGMVASRRDDLESLGYMLVYWLKGCLPWHSPDKVVSDGLATKLSTSIQELTCDLPTEFAKYFEDVESLDSDEEPSYFTLRNRFKLLVKKLNLDLATFDWNLARQKETELCVQESVVRIT